jgi:hypothetical protein
MRAEVVGAQRSKPSNRNRSETKLGSLSSTPRTQNNSVSSNCTFKERSKTCSERWSTTTMASIRTAAPNDGEPRMRKGKEL